MANNASRLALVSKRLRAIVEPIELRCVVVSGLAQLKSTTAKLERVRRLLPQGRGDIRHLFLSELEGRHALSAETQVASYRNYNCGGEFWKTNEGSALAGSYLDNADEFWALAAAFVQRASSTLQSLTLLASNTWFMGEVPFFDEPACPKVLGTLSGASFPELTRLSVVHDVNSEKSAFGEDASKFQSPATPLLRHLSVESPLFLDGPGHEEMRTDTPHPLLANLQTERPQLKHLFLSDVALTAMETRMILFGKKWNDSSPSGRKLPGTLQSVVVQRGATPIFRSDGDAVRHLRVSRLFTLSHKGLNVEGLGASETRKQFASPGNRHYETLLREWMHACLASLL